MLNNKDKKTVNRILAVAAILCIPLLLMGAITIKDYNWSNRTLLTSVVPGQSALPLTDQEHVIHTIATEFSHHELHEGQSFHYAAVDTLGSGVQKQILIEAQAADEDRAHLVFSGSSEGATQYRMWEAPTVVTGVQALTTYNRDRNSTKTPNVSLKSITDLATGGTLLDVVCSGGGQNAPGTARGVAEIILKDDTEYVVEIKSGAASNVICTNLSWYEADEAP